MPKRSLADQLELALQTVLGGADIAGVEQRVAPLVSIAQELRALPRAGFKARLKSELERKAGMTTQAEAVRVQQTAAPRLRVKNAAAAIDFYERAFGARETMRFEV